MNISSIKAVSIIFSKQTITIRGATKATAKIIHDIEAY